MNEVALTILPETAADAEAIERLHERTFGPGRYAKTAYRLREQVAHRLDVSFTARIGTLLVGSVRLSPVRIGDGKALLLGPLTVEPAFRERGVGQALIAYALKAAAVQGERLVILVGDEPYYECSNWAIANEPSSIPLVSPNLQDLETTCQYRAANSYKGRAALLTRS